MPKPIFLCGSSSGQNPSGNGKRANKKSTKKKQRQQQQHGHKRCSQAVYVLTCFWFLIPGIAWSMMRWWLCPKTPQLASKILKHETRQGKARRGGGNCRRRRDLKVRTLRSIVTKIELHAESQSQSQSEAVCVSRLSALCVCFSQKTRFGPGQESGGSWQADRGRGRGIGRGSGRLRRGAVMWQRQPA